MRTGGCMCGAVRFEAETDGRFSVCHCKMCQRWSAGQFMGVQATSFEITQGASEVTTFQSSDWASRSFCKICGSNLTYHAPQFGGPSVALGTLDEAGDLTAHVQYFTDKVPGGLALQDGTKRLTQAEIEAMYGDG